MKTQATLRGKHKPRRDTGNRPTEREGGSNPEPCAIFSFPFSIFVATITRKTTKPDETPTPPPRGPGSRHLSIHHSCRCNIGFLLAEQATYELPLLSLLLQGHVLSCVLEYFCRLDNAPCRWAASMRVATLVRCHCWPRVCNQFCWPWGHLSCCLPCWTKPPGKETYKSSPRLGE